MAPASDLAEGLLNDGDRPPVRHLDDGRELFAGRPVVHFNEVDEGVGRGCPRDEPRLDRAGSGPGHHPPRRPLGRAVRRRLRLGVRDLGCRPARPSRRRLRGCGQRATATGLLRAGRRDDQGRQPSRRDRLEPRLHHGWRAPRGPGSRHRRGAAVRGDGTPLAGHDPAVADHARRPPRGDSRPDDGPPQGQSHPGRLWHRRRDGRRGPRRPRPRCSMRWAFGSTSAATSPSGLARATSAPSGAAPRGPSGRRPSR